MCSHMTIFEKHYAEDAPDALYIRAELWWCQQVWLTLIHHVRNAYLNYRDIFQGTINHLHHDIVERFVTSGTYRVE